MSFEKEFEYVKKYLITTNGELSRRETETFRKRSEHIKNVCTWCLRIYNELDEITKSRVLIDCILLAATFHDVAYGVESFHNSHPLEGAQIWQEYAIRNNYDINKIEYVSFLIKEHSNKELLKEKDTPIELIILMEADILDEEGAMSICWDMLNLAYKKPQSYLDCYYRIIKYTGHILSSNPMITSPAKKFWLNKQKLIKEFIKQLEYDLNISKVDMNG